MAAIEFALISGVLVLLILNLIDFASYFFDKMQVANAAEMGAQAAWNACDLQHIPATTSCPALNSAVTGAVQSTSLGTAVALQSGSPGEGYYCVNSSNVLQYMSSVSSKPSDCSGAGMPSNTPGDYIQVQTTYTWSPIIPGLSVAAALPAKITASAWFRLG